jgi:hypothetical protein
LISVRSSAAVISSSSDDPQHNLDDSTMAESVDDVASEDSNSRVIEELHEKVSHLENELSDVRQRLEESSNLRAKLDEEVRNELR